MTSPIHDAVRQHYAKRIDISSFCCADTCCSSESSLYPADLLAALPPDMAETSYGCGDPITLASLQPRQTVLDLGSGAGLDCLLASQKVGPGGRVIGVDMTPEMIERARANAKRIGAANVEFRQGFLEELPVGTNSVDVVISNCVINLSPAKAAVFREVFRVLKAGGKLAVSDIVTDGELPEAVRRSMVAWAGCVAGAVDVETYVGMMQAAGFTGISIERVYFDKDIIDNSLDEMNLEASAHPRDAVYKALYSARITAYKP